MAPEPTTFGFTAFTKSLGESASKLGASITDGESRRSLEPRVEV